MMANRSLELVFWRVLDALDYWLTLTQLRILDALCAAVAAPSLAE
jgi:hypothetical protein